MELNIKDKILNRSKENLNDTEERFNRVSKKTNFALNIVFALLAAACIIPFLFVVIISLTSEASLTANGYRFWPEEWSLEAYKYIFLQAVK